MNSAWQVFGIQNGRSSHHPGARSSSDIAGRAARSERKTTALGLGGDASDGQQGYRDQQGKVVLHGNSHE